MRPVVLAALLASCATRPAVEPEPAGVAAPAPREAEPRDAQPTGPAARLAKGLREAQPAWADWPRSLELPKPENGYAAAFLWDDGACDGWRYDVLLDLEEPRIFWVKRTGSILGTVEYLGPAEIVADAPLVFRVRGGDRASPGAPSRLVSASPEQVAR